VSSSTVKSIKPADLICMNQFIDHEPIEIDLVYADAAHPENIFGAALYRDGAQFWLHRELADIVLNVARLAQSERGAKLVLKDGLRTIEAQVAMQETDIVKANPQWCEPGPNRLLSPPGTGGHPRGMAVDVNLIGEDGQEWDMGTAFDHLTTDPAVNPAARSYQVFPANVLANRVYLETLFLRAADIAGQTILPLPSEWWDFRFPHDYSSQFAAISDVDLPEDMRMT